MGLFAITWSFTLLFFNLCRTSEIDLITFWMFIQAFIRVLRPCTRVSLSYDFIIIKQEDFFEGYVGSIIISQHQGYQRHTTMSKGSMTTSRSSSWPLSSRIQGHHHYNEPIPCPSSGPHVMCVGSITFTTKCNGIQAPQRAFSRYKGIMRTPYPMQV